MIAVGQGSSCPRQAVEWSPAQRLSFRAAYLCADYCGRAGTHCCRRVHLDKDLHGIVGNGATKNAARAVGKAIAARARAGLKEVVFDRGGYRYHGRVKALADAAREAGLSF